MLLRGVALSSIVAAVAFFGISRQQANQEVATSRASLLERWRVESKRLSAADRAAGGRVISLLSKAAGKYRGDFIADELKSAASLEKTLRRKAVYVRGPIDTFQNPKTLEATALSSVKDAFTLCLLEPPEERTEKQLLRKVRSVYAGSEKTSAATAHVQRLGDVFIGLPPLQAEFRERVANAPDVRALGALRRTLERAPLEEARRAAKAELLLFALDEPGDKQSPTELDGERPHHVRVALVDIRSQKPLFRLRQHVDPSWLSDATRSEYARGVDSCALGFDVRQALLKSPER
jgi:hypothetical protein